MKSMKAVEWVERKDVLFFLQRLLSNDKTLKLTCVSRQRYTTWRYNQELVFRK